jgi:hypothetical protein
MHLWNVALLQRDYTALYPRRLSSFVYLKLYYQGLDKCAETHISMRRPAGTSMPMLLNQGTTRCRPSATAYSVRLLVVTTENFKEYKQFGISCRHFPSFCTLLTSYQIMIRIPTNSLKAAFHESLLSSACVNQTALTFLSTVSSQFLWQMYWGGDEHQNCKKWRTLQGDKMSQAYF